MYNTTFKPFLLYLEARDFLSTDVAHSSLLTLQQPTNFASYIFVDTTDFGPISPGEWNITTLVNNTNTDFSPNLQLIFLLKLMSAECALYHSKQNAHIRQSQKFTVKVIPDTQHLKHIKTSQTYAPMLGRYRRHYPSMLYGVLTYTLVQQLSSQCAI